MADDDPIADEVVSIRPDLQGWEKLQSQIDAKMKGVQAKVKLVADATGFSTSARDALKKYEAGHKTPEYKVALVADASKLKSSITAALSGVGGHHVDVGVDFDAKDLRAKVDAAAAAAGGVNVQVGVDLDAASLAGKVQAAVATVGAIDIRIGAEGQHLRDSVKLALVAGEPYEIKIKANVDTGNLGELNGLLAQTRTNSKGLWDDLAPPRLINFGGRGIQPYNLLIGSIVALTPLMLSLASSATQAGFALTALGTAGIGAAAALTGVVIGFNGILEALKLRETVQKQQTAAAANVDKTQANELKQQRAINEARREAIQDLETLKRKVIDLANQEKDQALTVEEKEAQRRTVFRNVFATSLDKRRAAQDVANAKTSLGDTQLDRKQTGEDLKDSLKKGIEGSDKVVNAKAATAAITSPAANLQDALNKLSPAARELYDLIDANQDTFDRLTRSIQQAVLPGFTDALREILKVGKDGKSSLSIAADAAGLLGGKIGDTAEKLAKLTRTKWFRKDFQKIIKANADLFDSLGDAMVTLVKPLSTIFASVSPLLKRFGGYVERLATKFADFIDAADKSGKLEAFFKKAGDELSRWYDLASAIGRFLTGIFTATAPSGGTVVDRLTDFFNTLADWSNSPQGQKGIQDFFDNLAGLPYGKIRDVVAQLGIMFGAGLAAKFMFANPLWTMIGLLATQNPEKAQQFLEAMTTFIIDGLGWLDAHKESAELFLAILTAYKAAQAVGKLSMAFGALSVPALAVTGVVTATTLLVTNITGKSVPELLDDNFNVPEKVEGQRQTGQGPEIFGTAVDSWLQHWMAVTVPNFLNLGIGKGGWGGLGKNLTHWLGTTLPDFLNLGEGAGWSALGKNMEHWFSTTLPEWMSGGESHGWDGFGDYAWKQLKDFVGIKIPDGLWEGIKSGAKSLKDHVADWLADFWQWLKDKCGIRSPSTIAADIGGNIVQGLWNGIVDKWTALLDTATKWIDTNFLDPLATAFSTAGAAIRDAFVGAFDSLTAKLDKPIKAALGWVNSYLIAPLNVLLKGLGVTEIPPISIGTTAAPTTVGTGVGNAVGGVVGGIGAVLNRAEGGTVPGFSPHSRADNIPAMLTANEYVQPVDAVKHYGTDFMEAVRTKQFPRYADGGLVASLVPKLGNNLATRVVTGALKDLSLKDMAASIASKAAAFLGGGTGGTAIGNQALAEIAETTARGLGATDKQLVALMEAGIVESGMRNINYGDRDSVGFLQQRPSQGWGTVAQLMNPAYATTKFINAAKRADKAGYTAGQLAQAVQRSAFPERYAAQQANATAILNRAAPYLSGYAPGTDTGTVTGGATQAGLVAFGRWLQARGYDVSEHPAFGGVTPGGHVDGSKHYLGRAIDVNHGAGTSAREQRYLSEIIGEAHRRGLHSIFMTKGHYNHAHFDYARGGQVGMPVRKYDSGGALPPGYTLAFNGTGQTETIRTARQEAQLSGPMRLDKRDIALLAHHIARASNAEINMDGRKVAEIANAYTYMPAGV